MKIAVSARGKTLESEMDPRFGRAAYFILVDPATMAFEVLENKQNLSLPQGAGIQAAQTVADHGAKVVITGNCGPKAFRVLQAAGVQVAVGLTGTVREGLERFKKGEVEVAQGPNVEGHW
jgi:predicted Fe-Mo cluster-binding NifX family protein